MDVVVVVVEKDVLGCGNTKVVLDNDSVVNEFAKDDGLSRVAVAVAAADIDNVALLLAPFGVDHAAVVARAVGVGNTNCSC